MRVITTFFSIESPRLLLDHEVDLAPNDPMSADVNNATSGCREWLGTHEGENRVALLEKSIQCHRRMHRKIQMKVLFTVVLID